ncbi:hypothetical protein GCM10014719_62140 [Planomonospora parontospora subsp. antibiotica]|nr:hypothetical protein GCM10014719_62140 [Planomonospora parontospora subsp. antibiotica]GII19451.1 hypothetical protein Ppa05_61770 [Planomonospora parontospora subsp. antibiotica]
MGDEPLRSPAGMTAHGTRAGSVGQLLVLGWLRFACDYRSVLPDLIRFCSLRREINVEAAHVEGNGQPGAPGDLLDLNTRP